VILKGSFTTNTKIVVDKVVKFVGENCIINIQSNTGFEVFNGNTSTDDPYPQGVVFEGLTVRGDGTNTAFEFKYCSDWELRYVWVGNVAHSLVLERTWGDSQLVLNCHFGGTPPDGKGLIQINTPENDNTNAVTFVNLIASIYNENAAVLHAEQQVRSTGAQGFNFYKVYQEGDGKFMTGYWEAFGIYGGVLNNKKVSFDFTFCKSGLIQINSSKSFLATEAHSMTLKIKYIAPADTKPAVHIGKGNNNVIQIGQIDRGVGLGSDNSYILIGDADLVLNNIIEGVTFTCCEGKSAIECGSHVYQDNLIVRNCKFKNLNSEGTIPTMYAIYTNGPTVLVEDCIFEQTSNYVLTNDISKLRLKGCKFGEFRSENSGTATFSGDGTTTQFSIAHGLVSTPTKVLVTPMTADAAADFYVTADDTNIYINYLTAPAAGTDNLKFSWYAEV